jgi:hypothetical protein
MMTENYDHHIHDHRSGRISLMYDRILTKGADDKTIKALYPFMRAVDHCEESP